MTQETKKRIKTVLSILFFPITGFYSLIKECKENDYQSFIDEWFNYMTFLIMWLGTVILISLAIYGLVYHFSCTIIPVSIITGFIFIFIILPIIIHKFIHRK